MVDLEAWERLAGSGDGFAGDVPLPGLRELVREARRLRAEHEALRPWVLSGEAPEAVADAWRAAEPGATPVPPFAYNMAQVDLFMDRFRAYVETLQTGEA